MAVATFQHRAFKIGDVKDIDMNGQAIEGLTGILLDSGNIHTLSNTMNLYAASGGILNIGAVVSLDDRININFSSVFLPLQAPTATKPAAVKGGIFFDTTKNKMQVCNDGTNWVDI